MNLPGRCINAALALRDIFLTDSPLFQIPEHSQYCPLCQQPLLIKSGKNGPFLGCSHYPQCHYIKPLHQHDSMLVKVLADEPCPQCGQPLVVKHGRYGMFIGCTAYPACHFVVHDEPEQQAGILCPECGKGHLTERVNKYGKHFYGCDNYPKCKYLLNTRPLAGTCCFCHYPLLAEKNTAKGTVTVCASKACQKQQPADAASASDSDITES